MQTPRIIIFVNKAFEESSLYKKEQVIGKSVHNFKNIVTDAKDFEKFTETLLKGEVWSGAYLSRRADGTTYWEHSITSPLKNAKEEVTHFISVKEDISKIKEYEELLKSAKEKAEKDNRLKSAFLANMSHEIRTPMNAIIGFTDVLIEEENDNDKIEKLEIIKQSSSNLLAIINDILDLSKIESGKVERINEVMALSKIVDFMYSLFYTTAKNKNIDFITKMEGTIPKKIFSDERHIIQILTNIISNAIKFTSQGKVELKLSCNNSRAKFIISDTGIGIAKEKQELVFDAFEQADTSTERIFGGTGLGLAITKKLVELLEGEITIESEEVGTSFLRTFEEATQEEETQ